MTLDKEKELEISLQVRNMVSNCCPFIIIIWKEWNNIVQCLVSFIHALILLCVYRHMPELALKTLHHVNHASKCYKVSFLFTLYIFGIVFNLAMQYEP